MPLESQAITEARRTGSTQFSGDDYRRDQQVVYADANLKASLVTTFEKGRLVNAKGGPASTKGEATDWSGQGWAMFVADTSGVLYKWSHETGK